MDLKQEGRQLALALVNIDDVVLARELSGSGINLLSFAGRSVVGTAVVGAGMATRAALLGAQVATKSALAVAGAAKGRIPGAGVAERLVYEMDQSLGRGGEAASAVASQGVALGKTDGRPPAEPIFGDAWLGKRLRPGATASSVLVDSAIDLTRLAALPLTLGTTTLANALASPAGHQVTRSFWDAVSAIVDTVAAGSSNDGSRTDRSERRAALLMVGMTPLTTSVQDILDPGMTRASAGDGRQPAPCSRRLGRIEASAGPKRRRTAHAVAPVLALEDTNGDGSSRVATIGKAIVEDSGALSRLAVAYTTLVAGLVTSSLQSADAHAMSARSRHGCAATTPPRHFGGRPVKPGFGQAGDARLRRRELSGVGQGAGDARRGVLRSKADARRGFVPSQPSSRVTPSSATACARSVATRRWREWACSAPRCAIASRRLPLWERSSTPKAIETLASRRWCRNSRVRDMCGSVKRATTRPSGWRP
jgi:hypothetical protein